MNEMKSDEDLLSAIALGEGSTRQFKAICPIT